MLLHVVPRLYRCAPSPRPAAARVGRILSVQNLGVEFPVRAAWVGFRPPRTLRALDGVSFTLVQGETLAVVGESGCGKSTLARAVLQLVPVDTGTISWCGKDL